MRWIARNSVHLSPQVSKDGFSEAYKPLEDEEG